MCRNTDCLAAWLSCMLVCVGSNGLAAADASRNVPPGQRILDATNVCGGLIVHLGCGDGKLTAELGAGEGVVVQGLDDDAANVEKAREYVASLGVYGKVSIGLARGGRLPYIDDLVKLIVIQDAGCGIRDEEIERVLCPGGVAVRLDPETRNPKPETFFRKPFPPEIDEWTHYLHDASGNAVARDTRAGPPERVQWVAAPRWPRSHEHTPSIPAMVSTGGRILYLMDEGIRGIRDPRLPERWALVARDAFSGVQLWRTVVPGFGGGHWKSHAHWSSPMSLPRRLVAVGERAFLTLGYRGRVAAFDTRTGQRVREYADTENTEEIVFADGILLLRRRKAVPDYPPGATAWNVQVRRKGRKGDEKLTRLPPASPGDETIVALDPETAKVLWQQPETRIVTLTLAGCDGRVCYHNFEEVVCISAQTGEELWRAPCKTWPDLTGTSGTLVMADGKVFYAGDRGVHAWSADDGRPLWKGLRVLRSAPRQPPDLFLANGLLWGGLTAQMNPGHLPGEESSDAAAALTGTAALGLDPDTGEVRKQCEIGTLVSVGHHVRCYRSKATERFLLWPKRGVEFVDIVDGRGHVRCDWFRGECSYGVMPAGGLIYAPPDPCICYLGVKLQGFYALAAASANESHASKPANSEERLERGPAYAVEPRVPRHPPSADWPTYRHDSARSGSTKTTVATDLKPRWTAELGGRLSSPVSAAGRVCVASVDAHQVHALSAETGQRLWSFTADARVDSPPTIHADRVLFGCRDGCVYSLRASDGVLAWRFRAAPGDRRIVAHEQVESVWPVPGSVLVVEGIAYFAAGRSSFLDGGMVLYALDANTGKVLHQKRLDGPRPDLARDTGQPYHMEGATSDILTSDGESVFLMFHEFDCQLNRVPTPATTQPGTRPVKLHLMARNGFLDDTWFDRVFWTYGRAWRGRHFAGIPPASGQLLVFDDQTVYALQGFPSRHFMSPSFTPGTGYVLRADAVGAELAPGKKAPQGKWSAKVPVRATGMVLAGETLFVAGAVDVVPPDDPYAGLEGRGGAVLWAVSATDGKRIAQYPLASPPVFDGMAAAEGKLFISMMDGSVVCCGACWTPQTTEEKGSSQNSGE